MASVAFARVVLPLQDVDFLATDSPPPTPTAAAPVRADVKVLLPI